MRSYHEQLQVHALTDLTNRAKSGIMAYMFVWLLIAFTFDLPNQHPTMFYLNTMMLLVILLSRVIHYLVMRRSSAPNVSLMNQWLVITVLAAAVQWGGMIAWVMQDPSLAHLKIIFFLTLPAFGLGGACTLSISSEIRTLYPSLMFAPLIAGLMLEGGRENYLLVGLLLFSLIYIFSSTRVTHNDYWEAITNHMVAEERAELMEKLSTTDPLTQLKNRMYFDSEYSKEWKRSSRMKCPISVLMLDLDFFKKINDTYGHVFGDEVLRSVAAVIGKEAQRPTDCVARYGGEEFVILLPNTDAKGAKIIAERMLSAVSKIELAASGTPVRITCSIGGATDIPNHRIDRSELIRQADTALYHAKNAGRNRYSQAKDIV